MLAIASPPLALGTPSRRAVKAAAILLGLAGILPKTLARHFSDGPVRCVRIGEAELVVLPTSLEGTLLIEEAKALVSENETVLIVRLATDFRPARGLVTVDVVRSLQGGHEVSLGLRPCLAEGIFPLSLARTNARAPDFFLTASGLCVAGFRGPRRWDVGAGIAVAETFFQANVWGGI